MRLPKLLVLATFLVSANHSYSQVVKLRAFELCLINRENPPSNVSWDEIDVLVVVNADKGKIQVYSKETQDYDIVRKLSEKYNYENDADVIKFLAIDGTGLRCHISYTKYRDPGPKHIATLIIEYDDYSWAYRLKEN